MALERLRTIESAVIMGGISGEVAAKIDTVAQSLVDNGVLNPKNVNQQKSANAIATGLVRGLSRDGEWRTDSVRSLIEAADDENRPANQGVARERLTLLGKAVFVAMRYSGDDDLVDRLWNPREVEEVLPVSLKGLGEEVVKNLITNEDILGELRDLDGRIDDMDLDVTITRDRQLILDEVEKTYDLITALRGLSTDEREQRKMVKAYLNMMMQRLDQDSIAAEPREPAPIEGLNPDDLTLTELLTEMQRLKRKVDMSGVTMGGGKDGGGMGLGAAESYQALEQVSRLEGLDGESVLNWAAQTVDWVAREQLFFAGSGWQQFGPYMEREVRALFKKNGKKEQEVLDAIEIVRSVLAPRLYEEAIMHSDGAISIFVKTLPQAGIFDNNEFNSSRRDWLLSHPLIGYFHDKLFDQVELFGLEAMKEMANSEKANIMAEKLASLLMSDEASRNKLVESGIDLDANRFQSLARVAVSIFLVDDLPGVILWANQSRPEMVDQIKHTRKLSSARVTGDVVVYDTMLRKSLGFSHPLTGLTRPVDIYRANNVWNEVILNEAEEAVLMLSDEIFRTEDGLKRCSDLGLKTLDRFDGMMSYLFGGTQAEALDSFNDLDKGLDKLQKLIQNHPDMADLGGVVAAKLIKAKVMALMAENRAGFSSNVMRALAIERSSVPKELGDALGRMSGSGMDSSFGSIKEAVSRLGFNFLGVVDLAQAIDMLITETDDPNQAHKNLNKKKAAMFLKAIVDLSGEIRGTAKKK